MSRLTKVLMAHILAMQKGVKKTIDLYHSSAYSVNCMKDWSWPVLSPQLRITSPCTSGDSQKSSHAADKLIEDSLEAGVETGAVFVNFTATYDTVNHRAPLDQSSPYDQEH